MKPYGLGNKRRNKLHPANECGICSENTIIKSRARYQARKEIEDEKRTTEAFKEGIDYPTSRFDFIFE